MKRYNEYPDIAILAKDSMLIDSQNDSTVIAVGLALKAMHLMI